MHIITSGALRVHISHSNLKNKTNWMSHEERRTRNDVGIDHSRDSIGPRLRFLFFLLILPLFFLIFSQFPSILNLLIP